MCKDAYIKELRRVIGHRKIVMPGIALGILDEEGRILLQLRENRKWMIPGGMIELGQSARETVYREAQEELGVNIEIEGMIGIYSDPKYDFTYPNDDEIQQCILFFKVHIIKGSPIISDDESLELRFFNYNDLPWQEMPLCCRDKVRDLQQFKGVPIIR